METAKAEKNLSSLSNHHIDGSFSAKLTKGRDNYFTFHNTENFSLNIRTIQFYFLLAPLYISATSNGEPP